MRSPIQTRFEDLPQDLAIFPLSGALLLPWGRLPLNIFEPRYLNMSLDALKTNRVFGMIQPDPDKTPKDKILGDRMIQEAEPALYGIGCAGRIASFEETEDGRLLILVKGVARFRVVKEIDGMGGYRRVRADYEDFRDDMEPPAKFDLNRERLVSFLKPYLDARSMPMNTDVLKGLSDATLVTSLCMLCPFDPREKQALLEAADMGERAAALEKLLQMGVFDTNGSTDTPKQ
jgi:Lon protease-like protein